jgi:hypothetical protein
MRASYANGMKRIPAKSLREALRRQLILTVLATSVFFTAGCATSGNVSASGQNHSIIGHQFSSVDPDYYSSNNNPYHAD